MVKPTAKEIMKMLAGEEGMLAFEKVKHEQLQKFSSFLDKHLDLFCIVSDYKGISIDDVPSLKLIIMEYFSSYIEGEGDD